jgi:hypothetical protein
MDANQPAPQQSSHGGLNGAFGKAGAMGDHLMAKTRASFLAAYGLGPQMQVHQKRRGRTIVTGEVAH